MTVDRSYDRFLANATSSLVAEGGQVLLERQHADIGSDWGASWDRVLLLNTPGSPTIYAVADATARDEHLLQQDLDALAGGLAQRGVLQAAPVSLVAVLACDPRGRAADRSLMRIKPRTFYPGLRPRALVVDLERGTVHAGFGGLGEAAEPIRRAASLSFAGVDNPHESGHRQSQRIQAFYRLMQGRQPLVTYLLVTINICFFAAEYFTGALNDEAALEKLGVLVPRLVEQGQWWRLLATTFLHGSVTHILFNMTSLFAVGTLTERLYGSGKFLLIYLGAGIIASLVSFFHSVSTGALDQPALGASGAIFGVAGALIALRFQRSSVIPSAVRRRVAGSITPLIFLSLGMSSLIPNVDNWAHVGGLAGGTVLSLLIGLERDPVHAD